MRGRIIRPGQRSTRPIAARPSAEDIYQALRRGLPFAVKLLDIRQGDQFFNGSLSWVATFSAECIDESYSFEYEGRTTGEAFFHRCQRLKVHGSTIVHAPADW